MPTIASLGVYVVTDAIKRRQLGDRVKRQFSPEILQIYCADSLFILESETKSCVYGESDFGSTGSMSACKHKVSGTISLPSRGSFHLSLTVLLHYRSSGSI